jgi:hypothetical protein
VVPRNEHEGTARANAFRHTKPNKPFNPIARENVRSGSTAALGLEMSIGRIVLGILLLLAGTAVTHVLYAMNEDGNLWNGGLFVGVLLAAVVATAVFGACRRFLSSRWARIVTGVSITYCIWLAILLVGDPESGMWLPVIVIFGIPFTAPVLIGAWFSSDLFMSSITAQQAAAGDARNARA